MIRSDGMKLRQALLNLLSNAAKFTEKGTSHPDRRPERARHRRKSCSRCADTGIGMTPEAMSAALRGLRQADAATTRKYGGTGLGLAITRRFCQLHGRRRERGPTPGQGSTLHDPAARPIRARPNRTGGPVSEADRVLLVEDNEMNRDMLSRRLGSRATKWRSPWTGSRVWPVALAGGIDVVLMDMNLPEIDGWEAARRIRADPKGAARAHHRAHGARDVG